MSKIMHLFIVPKSMNNKLRMEFIEGMKEQLKKPETTIIVATDIEYKTIVFEEGEQFSIIRKGDAYEFVTIEKDGEKKK